MAVKTKGLRRVHAHEQGTHERFLSIFDNKHRRGYNATIVSDPNRTFGHTFAHFYEQFGIRDKAEI